MKFIIYAKGSRALAVLNTVLERGYQPSLLVIEKNDLEIQSLSDRYRIKTGIVNNPCRNDHINTVKEISPQFILAVGYSKMIPKALLSIPEIGFFNCHGGLLPEYRGASPIPWQIINGELKGAAYVLKMTGGIDDGPYILSKEYSIDQSDDATSLTVKVNKIFIDLVSEFFSKLFSEEDLKYSQQSTENVCYWTRRVPKDGLIDWKSFSAQKCINHIRALTYPYPGAYTIINSNRIIIHKANIPNDTIKGVPGRYVGLKNGHPTIIAKDRAINILKWECQNPDCNIFPVKYGDDCSYE